MQCDYPLRVQLGPGLVVHAASIRKVGGYYTRKADPLTGILGESYQVPVTEEIYIACRRYGVYHPNKIKIEEKYLVANTEAITCKACAKAMGMDETRTDPIRYVIFKKSTGEYYKKGRYCSQPWVEDVGDATLYKVEGVAIKKTMRTYYETLDGRRIKYKDIRPGQQTKRKTEPNPDLELKTVTLVVGGWYEKKEFKTK
jgi:hypothetical protein